jgi:hypothetical protein
MIRNLSQAVAAMVLVWASTGLAGSKNDDLAWIELQNGRLVYGADSDLDRIPDFSTVGYEEGDLPIPDVPVKMQVEAAGDPDATSRIQRAIEAMSSLPPDEHGIRGALLLGPGVYRIAGTINLDVSGVVLCGSGTDKTGTVLVAEGLPRAIVHIGGTGEWKEDRSRRPILDAVVPVGASSITVDAPGHFFSVGDHIIVQWNMTEDFIHKLGMDHIPPRRDGGEVRQWPTNMALRFDRRIVAMEQTANGYKLTLNAALTQRMPREDNPVVWKYNFPGRVSQVGVENLNSDGAMFRKAPNYNHPSIPHRTDGSFFDSIFSEFDAVENAWMRNVRVENYNNIVFVHQHGRAITVEDVEGDHIDTPRKKGHAAPFAFEIDGQQVLMQRCNFTGRLNHVWATQARVAGPNVFRDSWAKGGDLDAGPHQRWATGTLWEQVTLKGKYDDYNQWNLGSGHGWAGAYNVLWNSTVDEIKVESPPGAFNWVIGCKGRVMSPQPGTRGAYYQSHGGPVEPASLYLEQLKERQIKERQTRLNPQTRSQTGQTPSR